MTPLLTGTLTRSDTGDIALRLNWSEFDETSFVQRWFMGNGIQWGDDPEQTKHRYSVPSILWFEDADGMAALVHANADGSQSNIGRGVGQGTANVRYVVLDCGPADYRKVNGLRSDLRGALTWFGRRSIHQRNTYDDARRVKAIALTLDASSPIRLSRSMNLHLRPHFQTRRDDDDNLIIRESSLIETVVRRPRPIIEHVIAHNAVRDLISLACWIDLGFDEQWVNRSDDPVRTLDGTARDDRWAPLLVVLRTPTDADGGPPRFLFNFDDLGVAGFGKWLGIRRHFARGVNPLMAALDRRNGGLEACLALSAIGLDGIGYQLAIDSGTSPKNANKESHSVRFRRVASEISIDHGIDISEWAQRAADASNGIKHANRDMPDVLTMMNTFRENCLVFRLWVATRVGVDRVKLARALQIDPMSRPYTQL